MTLTQPVGYRHVVGLTLWLHGHDLKGVNERYDFNANRETNRLEGRVPSDEVLADARSASALFAAGIVALLYVLAVQLGGPLAGLAAALAVAAAPYAALHLLRAKSDGAFAFFMLLGLALCLRAFASRGFSMRSAATVGLVLGLAFSMKLTAILSLPVLGLAGVMAALAPRARSGRTRPLIWVGLVGLVCWTLFVALNPFLWPEPVGRTAAQFEFRRDEMLGQQRRRPADAVHDLADRAERVLGTALGTQTSSRVFAGVPLDVPFAALGLIWLAAVARREWLRGRHVGPAALFLLWAFSYLAGTISGYLIDYNRYVMPVFLLAALTAGIGLSAAVRWALHIWTRRVAPTFRARHIEPASEVSAAQPG